MLSVTREGCDGRARPGQHDGQGTRIRRRGDSLGQLGPQAQGGGLQVIDEAVAKALGSRAQGGNLLGGGVDQSGRLLRIDSIELAEN